MPRRRVIDRFGLMVDTLRGQPMPPMPSVPGRRVECADPPASPEEIAAAIADGCTALELAAMAGITRQAAFERLRHQKEENKP